jgi:Sec-independent protein translocase protein TatA
MGVILLVAFLVLGPGKSIEIARTAGKVINDLRRTFTDIVAAADLEKDDRPANPKAVASREEPEERPASRGQK